MRAEQNVPKSENHAAPHFLIAKWIPLHLIENPLLTSSFHDILYYNVLVTVSVPSSFYTLLLAETDFEGLEIGNGRIVVPGCFH